MKIGLKLILGFLVVGLLVGVVGIFGIISNNNIQKNNELTTEITEHLTLLGEWGSNVIKLTTSTNLDDYNQIKKNIDNLRKRVHSQHKEVLGIISPFVEPETHDSDIKALTKISGEIIEIHKEKLTLAETFAEKYNSEKEGRYNIRTPLLSLDNVHLTEEVGFMQYYSKETLYQHKDQNHLDDWLESIVHIKDELITSNLNLSQEEKNDLLNELNLYEQTADIMGEIAIRQREIENEEAIKIEEIQKITGSLEEKRKIVVDAVNLKNKNISESTRKSLILVILFGVILALILGFSISRSISKPIQELKRASEEFKKGNLDYKINITSKDEIGELAETFDQMRLKIKNDYQKLNLTLVQNLKKKINELQETKQKLKKKSKAKVK